MDSAEASNQLRDELLKVINRYSDESDITVCQLIGILEAIKYGLIERMPKSK